MLFVIVLLNCLFANDIIKYPELLPIKNQEILEHIKQKEQPQFLDDNYWDDERILFSTYFGGSGYDCINDGAFDSQGNFIQVGYTGSPDLPIVGDAFQKVKNLNHDMFIVKWNPAGDVIWSTFLGGSGSDVLYSVAIDKNDDIIVAGRTESPDIIVSEDASQKDYKGESDFYIAKFTKDGGYVWSTYLGGTDAESQCRMVIDEQGNIYLGGTTKSTDLPTSENAIQRKLDKVWLLNGEHATKAGAYISKFSFSGQRIWGTYFATGTKYYSQHSLCWDDVLTSIDVYKDEIAFSWDTEKYYTSDIAIVTPDAEQKEGVFYSGWQTQVFKIDTAGTTLKYGTFYSGDDSWSKKVKYDKEGNLILHVATNRDTPKKDSVFKSTGYLTFVKYNRKNELEWDFGTLCSDAGGMNYDFDIDENNVLWTVGVSNCINIKTFENSFISERINKKFPTNFIFVLDLDNYEYWFSYFDLFLRTPRSIESRNSILNISSEGDGTNIKNAFQPVRPKNANNNIFVSFDLKDVFNYKDTTDTIDTIPIDTLEPKDEILFYPNPVNDYIYLKNIDTIKSIRIVDLIGKEYFNMQEIKNREINLSRLSIGVYFAIINEKNVFKIIKR